MAVRELSRLIPTSITKNVYHGMDVFLAHATTVLSPLSPTNITTNLFIDQPLMERQVCCAFEDRMDNRAEKEVVQLLEDSTETLNSSSGNSIGDSNSPLRQGTAKDISTAVPDSSPKL